MAVEKTPTWDAEYIKKRIGELIDTPHMTRIELRLTASSEEIPVLEYTIHEKLHQIT